VSQLFGQLVQALATKVVPEAQEPEQVVPEVQVRQLVIQAVHPLAASA